MDTVLTYIGIGGVVVGVTALLAIASLALDRVLRKYPEPRNGAYSTSCGQPGCGFCDPDEQRG